MPAAYVWLLIGGVPTPIGTIKAVDPLRNGGVTIRRFTDISAARAPAVCFKGTLANRIARSPMTL